MGLSNKPDGFLKRLLWRIGEIQSFLLLTLLYVVLWVPVGLVTRWTANWLRFKPPAQTNWQPRSDRVNRPGTLREPY